VRQTLQGGGVIVRFPRESNRLIDLPEDYSVLINQASSFTSVHTLYTHTDIHMYILVLHDECNRNHDVRLCDDITAPKAVVCDLM